MAQVVNCPPCYHLRAASFTFRFVKLTRTLHGGFGLDLPTKRTRRMRGQRVRVRRDPGEKAAHGVLAGTSFGLMLPIDKVDAQELTHDWQPIISTEISFGTHGHPNSPEFVTWVLVDGWDVVSCFT